MKPSIQRLLWLLAGIVWLSQPVRSDLLWMKKNSEPMPGILLTQTPKLIEFRPFRDGRFGTPELYPASEIDRVLTTIDATRLTQLSVANAEAYFEYAEELAVAANDSAALHTARRLYLIAAAHAERDIRISCLLGLRRLEATPDRKLAVSIYLATVAGDHRLLEAAMEISKPKVEISATERRDLLELVRAIRQRDLQRANELLGQLAGHSILESGQNELSVTQLQHQVRTAALSNEALLDLVNMELRLRLAGSEPEIPGDGSAGRSWAHWATRPTTVKTLIPTLTTLTEFDPRQTDYRDGEWTQPQGDDVTKETPD